MYSVIMPTRFCARFWYKWPDFNSKRDVCKNGELIVTVLFLLIYQVDMIGMVGDEVGLCRNLNISCFRCFAVQLLLTKISLISNVLLLGNMEQIWASEED